MLVHQRVNLKMMIQIYLNGPDNGIGLNETY